MRSLFKVLLVSLVLITGIVSPGFAPVANAEPTPTADLVITSFTVTPSQPTQGVAATIDITVTNQGSGAAAEGFVVQWKSSQAAPTGPADTVSGLAAGDSATVSLHYTFQANGNYLSVATVDTGNAVPEVNEANNLEILSLTVGPAVPDLQITKFTITPTSPVAGLPAAKIAITVTNAGGGNAGGFVVQWKSDQTAPSGPSQPVTGLAAGASKVVSFDYTFPKAGNFLTVATVDTDNTVAESNEQNNIEILPTTVQKAFTDLVVTSLTFDPAIPVAGWLTKVSITVKNQGNFPAGPFVVKWQPRPLAPALSQQINGLAPGASKTITLDYTFANAGEFNSTAEVDSTNLVVESVETNNKLTVKVVVDPPLADLVITSLTSNPPSPVAGLPFVVAVTVKNQGHIAAGPFIVKWTPKPFAPALSQQVNSLAVGASVVVKFSATYPVNGSYKSTAEVDSTNRVKEVSESNNTATLVINVVDAFIDLVITSISLKPGNPIEQSPATYSVAIRNIGNSPSGSFLLQLNPDALGLITPSLATVSTEVPNLNGGQTTTVNFTLVYPKDGNFRAVAKIDAFNVVKESNEDNNLKIFNATVLPIPVDLTILGTEIQRRGNCDGECPTINPAGNVVQGRQFTVLITVKNIGTAPATNFLVQWNPDALGLILPAPQTLSRQVDFLAGGATTVVAFDFEYPDHGNFRSVAKVDAFNTVDETNEENNLDILNMVVDPAYIDLTITSFSLSPASPTRASKVTATIVVQNQGEFRSGRFAVQWKPNVEGGFGPIAQVNGLQPGESRTITLEATYSKAGDFTTSATVDVFDEVIEPYAEGNNVATLNITVQPRKTNVSVSFTNVKVLNDLDSGLNGSDGEWQMLFAVLDPSTTCQINIKGSTSILGKDIPPIKGARCRESPDSDTRDVNDDDSDKNHFNPDRTINVTLIESTPLVIGVAGFEDDTAIDPDFPGYAVKLLFPASINGSQTFTVPGQKCEDSDGHCFDVTFTVTVTPPPALAADLGGLVLPSPAQTQLPDGFAALLPDDATFPTGLFVGPNVPDLQWPNGKNAD